MKGTLYIVSTPIGNLKDITYRAVETLKDVDYIFCEDTRISSRLLNHYDIKKQLKSMNAVNENKVSKEVLSILLDGKNIAYLSDAGTPLISDPGRILVKTAREAGIKIVPIPGPSALTAMLSVNNFVGKTVIFEGFLEKKQEKNKKKLKALMEIGDIIVVYESPYRIIKLLESIKEVNEEIQVLVGRELTKKFEEIISGNCGEIIRYFEGKQIKGEFTVLISSK